MLFCQSLITTPICFTEDSIRRESGRKVQLENVKAAKAIADVIRTSLGPRAMLKVGGGVAQQNCEFKKLTFPSFLW